MKCELLTDVKYRGKFIKAGVIVDLELPRNSINAMIDAGSIRKAEPLQIVKVIKPKELKEVIVEEDENKNNKTSSIEKANEIVEEATDVVKASRGRPRSKKE